MPRIRSIKPEFFSDEKLAPLPPITRLVFLGLISMADDAGRLIDNLKAIDAFIFPESDDSARDSIAQLVELGRVVRYTSGSGQRLLQLVNWERHQKIDHRSIHCLPAPSAEDLARASRGPREDLASPSREPRETLAPDLGSRILDLGSRIGINAREARESDPDGPGGAEPGEAGEAPAPEQPKSRKGKGSSAAAPADPVRSPEALEALLDQLLAAMPKRHGTQPRRRAREQVAKRLREGRTPEQLLDGARRYRVACDADRSTGTRFVLQAATFFGPDEHFLAEWAPESGDREDPRDADVRGAASAIRAMEDEGERLVRERLEAQLEQQRERDALRVPRKQAASQPAQEAP